MTAKEDEFSTEGHDWQSQAYVDEWIRRDVQRDDERRPRLKEMLTHISLSPSAEIDVLDVGGGFGVVTQEVLRAFPHARVTLQDYSQPMLSHARSRLAGHADQVSYVLADLRDPSWADRAGGPFDLVVSGWAIHNLEDAEPISACYKAITRLLKSGAPFLDYDLFDFAGGVELHIELLRSIGFTRVDSLWRQAPAAIIAAYAPAAS